MPTRQPAKAHGSPGETNASRLRAAAAKRRIRNLPSSEDYRASAAAAATYMTATATTSPAALRAARRAQGIQSPLDKLVGKLLSPKKPRADPKYLKNEKLFSVVASPMLAGDPVRTGSGSWKWRGFAEQDQDGAAQSPRLSDVGAASAAATASSGGSGGGLIHLSSRSPRPILRNAEKEERQIERGNAQQRYTGDATPPRQLPFDKGTNPKRRISMRLAENRINAEMVRKKYAQSYYMALAADDNPIVSHNATRNRPSRDFQGQLNLRKALALHLGWLWRGLDDAIEDAESVAESVAERSIAKDSAFNPPEQGSRNVFDPAHITVMPGLGAAIDALATCLSEPGDVWLVPAPLRMDYADFLKIRADVSVWPVYCADNGWSHLPSKTDLDAALLRAKMAGKRVPILMLCNPSNPLGVCWGADEIVRTLHWAALRNVHVVCDETYAGFFHHMAGLTKRAGEEEDGKDEDGGNDGAKCLRAEPPTNSFTSIATLAPSLRSVTLVCDVSDQLGFPEISCACVVSASPRLAMSLSNLNRVGAQLSHHTQEALTSVLEDREFVREAGRLQCQHLGECFDAFAAACEAEGFPYLASSTMAGMSGWVHLGSLLPEQSFAGERALLRHLLHKADVVLSAGHSSFSKEPGWFSCCFAQCVSPDAVAAAFKRISIEKERISSREVVGVQLISVAPSDAKHVEDIERQRSEFL